MEVPLHLTNDHTTVAGLPVPAWQPYVPGAPCFYRAEGERKEDRDLPGLKFVTGVQAPAPVAPNFPLQPEVEPVNQSSAEGADAATAEDGADNATTEFDDETIIIAQEHWAGVMGTAVGMVQELQQMQDQEEADEDPAADELQPMEGYDTFPVIVHEYLS